MAPFGNIGNSFFPAFFTGMTVYTLAVLFSSVGVVHFNPAITLSIFFAGKIGFKETILYFLAQTIGGMIGAVFLLLSISYDHEYDWTKVIQSYALDVPVDGNISAILISEVITSCCMCLTTLYVVYDKGFADKTGVLHIGMSVFLGIAAGSRIGAGCLNPLRSIAPHFFNPIWFANNWEFMIGPCVGAVFAGILFSSVLVSKTDGRRLSVISNFR